MIEKTVVEEAYFKEDSEKYRINTPKARGDRGKNYYRDFTKDKVQADPEVGRDAPTKVSKKDEANFMKNMKGKL
jgi:hypothetical protein